MTAAAPEHAAHEGREPDILFVDDDPCDVALARRAFRRAHLEDRLVILNDGEEALSYLLREGHGTDGSAAPSVVLLDLNLPRVDGLEVLRRLRQDEALRHVPVVVVSSSPREADVRRAYGAGANSYVIKRVEEKPPGQFLVDIALYWTRLNEVAK